MTGFNKIIIMGNLTKDPDLRYTPQGTAVAKFSVAVNRTWKDKNGEKQESVSFIPVVVWGRMGEVCSEYLSKGSAVHVEGRLQSRSWETDDGQKRSTLEVISEGVNFVGPKKERQNTQQGEGSTETVDLDNEEAPF